MTSLKNPDLTLPRRKTRVAMPIADTCEKAGENVPTV